MKKLLLYLILILITPVIAFAEGLNREQLQLRMEIVKFLSAEGISSSIDDDGDVRFEIDDHIYYFIINEAWSAPDPLSVTLYREFIYDEVHSYEKIQKCINLVNQYNVVKLYCSALTYVYRSDIFCKDIKAVKSSFRPLLDQYRKAIALVDLVLDSDLHDVDIVNEKEKVLDYALALYSKGEYETAVHLLNYLANSGYEQAYGFLGMAYEDGNGVEKDDKKMIDMYNKAIKAGYNWCAYHLAQYYENKKDYDLAMKNYVLCSANEGTYRSAAFFAIGRLYENGIGVTMDMDSAVKYYRKSVQYSTVLESEARLALIRLGIVVDPMESFVMASHEKLKRLKPDDMYRIGLEFESGKNGRYVSLPEAYSYFIASADNGYPAAMIKLGDIYVDKYYPFNDAERSNKAYQKAIKILKKIYNNDADACYQLGCMKYYGKGVVKNLEDAAHLFNMGAMKGHPEASYMTGLQSLENLDYPEAYKYFKIAAEAGVGMAMFELAKLYEAGLGVRYDSEEAIRWYQKCYESDCEKSDAAADALKKLSDRDGKY